MTERNPYPGPIPLSDPQMLKGRERDVDRLLDLVGRLRIIEMHGESGVGKSSFLRAGLIPNLERRGYTAVTVSEWEEVAALGDRAGSDEGAGDAPAASAQQLWLAAVDRALAASAPLYHHPEWMTSPEGQDRYLGLLTSIPNLVIVFDQLEELLRSDEKHGRTLGRRFLDYVAAVAKDDRFSLVQILSLRSEYVHELREPIEEPVVKYKWIMFQVPPVNFQATIPEIVEVDPTVDEQEVKSIHRLWNIAAYGRETPIEGTTPSIGLLELQAFLWSMAASPDLQDQALAPHSTEGGQQAFDMFVDAMEAYVGTSLSTEADLYADRSSTDDAEARGRETVLAAAMAAPHLSSAGYKLVRDTDELARISIPSIKDLRLRRAGRGAADHLDEADRALLDRAGLLTDRGEIPAGHARARSNLADHEATIEQAAVICREGNLEDDPRRLASLLRALWHVGEKDEESAKDRLSGRMYGGDPIETVAEMVANYERALQWMERNYIIRLTPTTYGGRVTALVHDGFGVPLARWGRTYTEQPVAVLASLVAISGETVIDRDRVPPLTSDELLGGVVDSVRWLGCEIRAGFENMTFRHCDFRGSIFVASSFENVTFHDCNLWGVLFLRCAFDGCRFDGGAPLQTLTIRESKIRGDGVTFRNLPLESYGLFFDRVEGGPWAIEACEDLSHVSLDGDNPDDAKGNLAPGMIHDSNITHLTLGAAVNPGTCMEDSTVTYVKSPTELESSCPPAETPLPSSG